MKTRRDVLHDKKSGDDLAVDPAPSSRREFLTVGLAATGGLLVAMRTAGAQRGAAAGAAAGFPTAYVQIDPDGRVRLWSAQPEMGEGTKTSLQMIVAEELDADWTRVVVDDAGLDPERYGGQGVGGSDAIRSDWDTLRRIGATARALLVQAAAEAWGVEAATCTTAPHNVRHPASGRDAAYGALAARAATLRVPATSVPLKDPAAFRLVGTRVPGVDNAKLVRGERLFGLDVRRPGLRYAAIAKSPVFGQAPVKIDAAAARAVPGVRAVIEVSGDANPTYLQPGVAVVADSTWAAFKGREALRVEWAAGAFAAESDATLRARFVELLAAPPFTLHESGRVDEALAGAAHVVDNTYAFPFVSHATLEPHNCTADVGDGRCDIVGPLQMPASARAVVARVLGVPPATVQVTSTRIGGGFGRRLMSDSAAEAAVVSRAAGGPVMVVDSREGDLQHDYYRPAAMQRIRAGLDAAGRLVAWDHTIASASRGAYRREDRPPYSTETYGAYIGAVRTTDHVALDLVPTRIPHARLRYGAPETGVPTGAWRAPSHVVNAFAIETTIDELAAAGRVDPVEIRRALLGELADHPRQPDEPTPYDPARMRRVIDAVVERSGFGRRVAEGRARGFAAHHTFGSYCAHVVEASVERTGSGHRVVVHRVWSVADVGQPVNRSMLEAQMQGGVIDGLGSAFYGEVPIASGRATSRNFGDYRMIRHDEAPRAMDVHFLDSRVRPTGFGEPPLPPIAPAVANAVAAATGVRLRQMPFVRAGFVLG
ncbi:MAG: molybdopterin cofactor-binding domain-containing protein [Vicinamibacterales bacterium]